MKGNFDACMAEVFAHEGGYVNDSRDPGGETNFGISKRAYPKENIRGMTKARAAQIYRADYWDAVRGDDLPAGIDLVAFDAAVNSGVSRGAKWVQRALGVSDDGKIGPATIAAAKRANSEAVIRQACAGRMTFLRGLGNFGIYGKGWTRRVSSVEGLALRMASGAAVRKPAPVPPQNPEPVKPPTGPFAAILAGLIAAVAALLKWAGVW